MQRIISLYNYDGNLSSHTLSVCDQKLWEKLIPHDYILLLAMT